MAIDPNIALQYGKNMTQLANPMEMASQVMNMKRLAQQNQVADAELADKAAVKNAYRSGMTTGPDGKVIFNKDKAGAALAEAAPDKYLEQKSAWDQEEVKYNMGLGEQFLKVATTPEGWAAGRKMLSENNYKYLPSVPETFSPQSLEKLRTSYLSNKENLDNQFRNKELESKSLDRKEARDERRFQSGIKMDEKMQGLKTPYGLANTVDDAKQLKDAHESKIAFDTKLDEMIGLRKQYGTEYWNREAVARGKQLSKDLLLEYKNMAKLGVLSKSDEDIINAIIPEDILGHSMGAPGQDPILSNLEKFKADKQADFQTRIGTRTRKGLDETTSENTKLAPPPKGTVRMQSRDGKIKDVPDNLVGEAIASGGKKI